MGQVLAIPIAIGVQVVGGIIQSNVDADRARRHAERDAAEARRAAEAQAQAEAAKNMAEAEAQRQEAVQKAQYEQAQLSLMEQVYVACKEDRVEAAVEFLRQLDDTHFSQLEQRPVAAAGSIDTVQAINRALIEERQRRQME